MKILIADKFPDKQIDEIKKMKVVLEYAPKLKSEELPEAAKEADILIVRSTEVHADCIEKSSKLSLIIRAGAGVNNIDMKAASERGIYVANCPGKNSIAVAELAMGLILSLDRSIPDNVMDLRAGKWNKGKYSKADGIFGKTLGVIGVGQIGKEVIKRAIPFGLKVVAWSRSLTPEASAELGATYYPSVKELIPQCDIISVHLALKPETRGLISKELIAAMKPGTLFINTARAEIADEAAILEAVKAGKIRAGLDVIKDEPEAKEGEFTGAIGKLPDVYVTHHIGASTEQAQDAVASETVRILKNYISQGIVDNWVNRCKKTKAMWQLVVRHYDKPGVLANVLNELKSDGINIEEVENVIFEGEKTACCTIRLDSKPSDSAIAKIGSRPTEVINATLIDLGDLGE
ncbi:MAG: hypothetical protein HZA77_06160 [Candidatus Schekmanbacteria bacterium]|nr:hypothetical protein [Candidatus Schekmanbacteria bacterium]